MLFTTNIFVAIEAFKELSVHGLTGSLTTRVMWAWSRIC